MSIDQCQRAARHRVAFSRRRRVNVDTCSLVTVDRVLGNPSTETRTEARQCKVPYSNIAMVISISATIEQQKCSSRRTLYASARFCGPLRCTIKVTTMEHGTLAPSNYINFAAFSKMATAQLGNLFSFGEGAYVRGRECPDTTTI